MVGTLKKKNYILPRTGKVGVPFVASYSAAKFALHGFFDALRQELQLQNANVSISTFVIGEMINSLFRCYKTNIDCFNSF